MAAAGKTYEQLQRDLVALAEAQPRAVRLAPCGVSVAGAPLQAITVAHEERPAATVLVIAGLHAMEHVGPLTALALARRAAAGEANWRQRRLVVVPLVNPDGFLAVERAVAQGQRRFLRRNARGVDLNRNFAVHWDGDYYLSRLLAPLFAAGSAPLSEPETRAIDDLAARVKPDYAVSLHAFGEWIYVPYAGRREAPRDLAELLALGRAMAARQPRTRYQVMQLARRSRLFAARGAEIDHLYERHGALSFLFEIGAGPRLSEPSTWLDPYRWFTPAGARLEGDIANVLPALDLLSEAPPRRARSR